MSFFIDSPWAVEPLLCAASDAAVLPAPRPSLTIGLQSSHFLAGKAFADLQPYVAPVECDQALTVPFVAVSTATEGSVLGIRRNLHFLWERTHADVDGSMGLSAP